MQGKEKDWIPIITFRLYPYPCKTNTDSKRCQKFLQLPFTITEQSVAVHCDPCTIPPTNFSQPIHEDKWRGQKVNQPSKKVNWRGQKINNLSKKSTGNVKGQTAKLKRSTGLVKCQRAKSKGQLARSKVKQRVH